MYPPLALLFSFATAIATTAIYSEILSGNKMRTATRPADKLLASIIAVTIIYSLTMAFYQMLR